MGKPGETRGRPSRARQLAKLLSDWKEGENTVADEAMGFLLAVGRGEVRASVGTIRARMNAYIELLDRKQGKPTATIKVEQGRTPGTVIIGENPDSPDPRTLPVPDELPN